MIVVVVVELLGQTPYITSQMERNTLPFAPGFGCNCVVAFLAIFAAGAAFALFSLEFEKAHGNTRSGLHSPDPLWNSRPWDHNAAATFLIW